MKREAHTQPWRQNIVSCGRWPVDRRIAMSTAEHGFSYLLLRVQSETFSHVSYRTGQEDEAAQEGEPIAVADVTEVGFLWRGGEDGQSNAEHPDQEHKEDWRERER